MSLAINPSDRIRFAVAMSSVSFTVTSQVSAGSQGRPSASMTRVSKKCLPCFAAVER